MNLFKKNTNLSILSSVIFLFILINQFSRVRDAYTVEYWISSVVLIVILLAFEWKVIDTTQSDRLLANFLALPLILFAVYIPISSGFGPAELKAAFKYTVISGVVYFAYRSSLTSNMFVKIISTVLIVQAVIFFLALTNFSIVQLEQHGQRHGLVLAPVGTIWRVAGLTFPFFAYQALRTPNYLKAGVYLGLTAVAVLIILLDGTRTGLLVVILGGIASFFLAIWRTSNRQNFGLRVAGIATIILTLSAFDAFPLPSGNRSFSELSIGIQNLIHKGADLQNIDSVRQRQVETAIDAIKNQPISGTGWLGPLSVDNYVIHNVYLQIWASIGIIGLLIYLSIFAPAFWYFANWLKNKQADDDALMPLTIVFGYMFSSLFHPVSTELTEWVLVALSLGLLIKLIVISRT